MNSIIISSIDNELTPSRYKKKIFQPSDDNPAQLISLTSISFYRKLIYNYLKSGQLHHT